MLLSIPRRRLLDGYRGLLTDWDDRCEPEISYWVNDRLSPVDDFRDFEGRCC